MDQVTRAAELRRGRSLPPHSQTTRDCAQAVALDPGGSRLHDKELPEAEQRLRQLFTALQAHGPVLMVVDQPATIGALPVGPAGLRAAGRRRRVLPSLATSLTQVLTRPRQIADEVEGLLGAHPLARVLTTRPGVG